MNNTESFSFEDLGEVRCVKKDAEFWFIAQDVCQVLGIISVKKATRRLCNDERGNVNWETSGGKQRLVAVSESGLYTIILRSQGALVPGTLAFRFRRWVTAEVLPALRKTGTYTTGQKLEEETAHLSNKEAYAEIRSQVDAEVKEAWRLRQLRKYGKTWN